MPGKNNIELIVHDMDQTIIYGPSADLFYDSAYGKNLEELILDHCGKQGVQVVDYLLARGVLPGMLVTALNIPIEAWGDKVTDEHVKILEPNPKLVAMIRQGDFKKVVYTASPKKLALKMLAQVGFDPETDFDLIIAGRPQDFMRLKYSGNPIVFRYILAQFQVAPENCWSVGDNWETDLRPAAELGIKTCQIGQVNGHADLCVATLEEFYQKL